MIQRTGEYEKYLQKNVLGDYYLYTFTPRPLMEGDFFKLDEELSAMLIKTHRQLGILEGMMKHLPNNVIIQNFMMIKECYFSRLIDYNEVPFTSALKAIGMDKDELPELENIVSAYQCSLNNSVSSITLSRICTVALYGHDAPVKTSERKDAVVWDRVVTPWEAYNPTVPERILPALADISAFLRNDEVSDILIKTALVHYQFEMIHPYECYNGIVGRIMFPMILHEYGIKAGLLIGLSEFLYYNKNSYFETLRTTQYSGGYIALIKFFVQGIYESAKRASKQIEMLTQIITEDEKKIKSLGSSVKRTLAVYNHFKAYIFSEIRTVADDLDVSFNTISKSVHALCELDILQIEKKQSRHRVFVYGRLLDILSRQSD